MKKFAQWISRIIMGEEVAHDNTEVIKEEDDCGTVYDDPRVYEASVLVLC